MAERTVYLVTGASRGIGAYIVNLLLARPNATVFASVRSSAAKDDLLSLPKHASSTCIPLQIDSSSDTDVPAAAKVIRSHGIDHIDVVVANAGMVTSMDTIANTTPKDVLEHVNVNCAGVLRLIHGLGGLLGEGDAAKENKFVVMSSSLASIGSMEPLPDLAYGISKAAVNFLARKMHDEWKGCSVAVMPGFVKTEMGNFAAKSFGMSSGPPLEIKDSAEAMVKLIDGLTRAKDGGKFLSYDGSNMSW